MVRVLEIAMKTRRNWKVRLAAVAVLGSLFLAQAARAALVYDYVPDSTNNSYSAGPNQVINILVYLKETVTSPSQSLITSDGGLFSGGMALSRSATGLPANPSTITGVTFNAVDFKGPTSKALSITDANLAEAIDTSATSGVPLGNTGGGASPVVPNEVYLGSFQITTGSTAGTTNFSLRVIPGGGNTLTNQGNDLDSNSTSPAYTGVGSKAANFTVTTVVPEPASAGLFLGACLLGLARRRRN